MAIPSWDRQLDTMVTTALDTMTKDPINALTDSGEKFLGAAASLGRVFVVNDAESIRHPVLYDHGEDSTLYYPDEIDGAPTTNSLSATAKEILTQAIFTLPAATRNINFPQSQPPGNMIDYVSSVVKANMMSILNQEERLLVVGQLTGTNVAQNDPHENDRWDAEGKPFSLGALYYDGTNVALGSGGDADQSAYSFANIKVDDVPKWNPLQQSAAASDHSGMITEMQKAMLTASYSEIERPTHVYMALGSFEKMLALLRASAALPDPVNYNIGKAGTVPFAGMTCDWSRYLAANAGWHASAASAAHYPILGINWNSLRFNTVRAGTTDSSLGFIRQLGSLQPHPLLTNLFKRIEWKRNWSLDNGRRSFFTIYNNATIA